MNEFTLYGWVDMYWEVGNKFGLLMRSRDDFFTGFLYKTKGAITLEWKAGRKTIIELFNDNNIYNLQFKKNTITHSL